MTPEKRYSVASMFNALGGISGLLSIGVVFWNGGKVVEKVENQEVRINGQDQRINKIENDGSNGLKRHEGLDDQRVTDISARLRRCEDDGQAIRNNLSDIKGDLREIKAYLGINGNTPITKPK